MKIAISAESTIDLPNEILEKYKIKTVPFTILLGDRMGLDGVITPNEIFDYVAKNKILPKTSAVNQFQYEEHFANILQEYNAIIHISLSGDMSCAFSNAVEASKKFKNVYVIDSRSLSTGIALLAIKASKMVNDGVDLQEIITQIKNDTGKVQAGFVLNKLDYLRKGGRCSGLVCFGANLLHIRPQILVKNGKMAPYKKYRGNYDYCVGQYCRDTLQEFPNNDKSVAFVTYTTASDEAVESAYNCLKDAGFKEIYKTNAGATISSHCGPNTLGILFITK